MLRHAIVCFVIVLFDASQITTAQQFRDLSRLIENLQQNEEKYINDRDDQSQALEKNNDAISSQELDELINQAANYVHNRNENKSKKRYLQNLKFNEGRIKDVLDENLSQFLSSQKAQRNSIRDVLPKLYKAKSLDLGSLNTALLEDGDSKVYLILDTQANLNKKDIKGVSNILSQILSGSTGTNRYSQRDPIKRKRRYKGFPIAEGSLARRRNRDSKELYSLQDSLEDYKPKRVRGDYGGGGGRTPIPFIRHRDIYEKE